MKLLATPLKLRRRHWIYSSFLLFLTSICSVYTSAQSIELINGSISVTAGGDTQTSTFLQNADWVNVPYTASDSGFSALVNPSIAIADNSLLFNFDSFSFSAAGSTSGNAFGLAIITFEVFETASYEINGFFAGGAGPFTSQQENLAAGQNAYLDDNTTGFIVPIYLESDGISRSTITPPPNAYSFSHSINNLGEGPAADPVSNYGSRIGTLNPGIYEVGYSALIGGSGTGNGSGSFSLLVNTSPIPEPSGIAVLIGAISVFLIKTRKRLLKHT